MRIDGKGIADEILADIARKVAELRQNSITPALAVIHVGNNPASMAYIRQKQKAAERIGAVIIMSNTLSDVERFNADPAIHGLIIQRPVPDGAGVYGVNLKKDVDGFELNSPYIVPVALAVDKILQIVHADLSKNIVVIGRGDTAGKPIAEFFRKRKHNIDVIHSRTKNPEKIIKRADVIISCVGKKRIVTADMIKSGVVLISVGIWRDVEGKLHGDYEVDEIAGIASFYTPTPGGVGPVNVACLMQNLVKACMIQKRGTL